MFEDELAVRASLFLGGGGRNGAGSPLDARRGEGTLLQAEVVQDQEPKEAEASGGTGEPEQFAAGLERQDAVRGVELRVVVVRDDGQELLQNGRRVGRVFDEIVEESDAFLMLEGR